MMKHLIILALLASLAFADTFTFQGQGVVSNSNLTQTETWQIGYGAQQITEVGGNDMVIFTSILAFVVLAAGFAYLHSKSNSFVWGSIWLALMFVMVLVAIMGMQLQALNSGDATTANIMVVLFGIIFWILAIIMIFFAVKMVKGFFDLMQEAAHGKRK